MNALPDRDRHRVALFAETAVDAFVADHERRRPRRRRAGSRRRQYETYRSRAQARVARIDEERSDFAAGAGAENIDGDAVCGVERLALQDHFPAASDRGLDVVPRVGGVEAAGGKPHAVDGAQGWNTEGGRTEKLCHL